MTHPGKSLLILAVASLLGFNAIAHAAGALDATFGSGGRAGYALKNSTQSTAQAMAMLPEGKVLVVGACTSQAAADYCLRRLNADGSTDTTFATAGESVIDWAGRILRSRWRLPPMARLSLAEAVMALAASCDTPIAVDST